MEDAKDRLENLKAHKIVQAKLKTQNKYRDLAKIAIEDPKSFAYHFSVQQAEFVVTLYYSLLRSPFRAVQEGLNGWIADVTDPGSAKYLYVVFKNNKLIVDLYRIKRDFSTR